jgi:hypothetical protein
MHQGLIQLDIQIEALIGELLLGVPGALLGIPGEVLGVEDELLRLGDGAGVALGLLALDLLPAQGQLEVEDLEDLVALPLRLGNELLELGTLLFGLVGCLDAQLGDLAIGGSTEDPNLPLSGSFELIDFASGADSQLLGLALGVAEE